MESSTKTYLVGKGAKTLVGNNVPQNSLDISKSATQIYHIVPSCAYIINNTDGTAAPQEFSFFLFKKENLILHLTCLYSFSKFCDILFLTYINSQYLIHSIDLLIYLTYLLL